jgi:hypothetical protein
MQPGLQAVDAAATSQRLALGVTQAVAVQALGGFGLALPVAARVANTVQVTHGDVVSVVVVFFARLGQLAVVAGVGDQAVEQQAVGGAADDGGVEGVVVHGLETLLNSNGNSLPFYPGVLRRMDISLQRHP